MSMKLAKVVEGGITRQARLTMTCLHEGAWHVAIICRSRPARRVAHSPLLVAEAEALVFRTCEEALAHTYAQFVTHFSTFSEAELAGGGVAWGLSYHDAMPLLCLDLAHLVVAEVEELLVAARARRPAA